MAKKFGLPYKHELHLHYLLFYHLFFSAFFTWYILNFGGDSSGYWRLGMQQVIIKGEETWFSYWGTSTTFILWLCYFPAKILGLDYLTGNILFGFLGFIGIRYIFVLVGHHFPTNHKVLNIPLYPTVFYFLNLHFWTAGVGKDAISFWGIAWFLFALQNYKTKWWQCMIAIAITYMVRPHMGQALIAGSALAILLGSELKFQYKIILGSLALAATVYLMAGTLEFLKMDDFDVESIMAKSEMTSGNLNNEYVGSGVDISSYPWPMRLFTYLFRPLFFDAHNIVALFSSVENLLYLWLSFYIYRNWTPEAIRDMPLFIKAGMITFLPVTIAFMNSLSNLGVIMRMKNMTMIYFLLFCLWLIVYQKKLRYQRVVAKYKEEVKRLKLVKASPKKRNDPHPYY